MSNIFVFCVKMEFDCRNNFGPCKHIKIATCQVMGNHFPLLYDVSSYEHHLTKELAFKQRDCSAERTTGVTSMHAVLSSNIALGASMIVRTCRQ